MDRSRVGRCVTLRDEFRTVLRDRFLAAKGKRDRDRIPGAVHMAAAFGESLGGFLGRRSGGALLARQRCAVPVSRLSEHETTGRNRRDALSSAARSSSPSNGRCRNSHSSVRGPTCGTVCPDPDACLSMTETETRAMPPDETRPRSLTRFGMADNPVGDLDLKIVVGVAAAPLRHDGKAPRAVINRAGAGDVEGGGRHDEGKNARTDNFTDHQNLPSPDEKSDCSIIARYSPRRSRSGGCLEPIWPVRRAWTPAKPRPRRPPPRRS